RHHRTYITSILSSTPPPPRSTPFPYTTLFRSPATSVDVGPTPTSLPQSSRSGNTHKQQIWSYAMNEFQFHRATTLAQAVQSGAQDRKSTRLNSSHVKISYAVFCLKKKKK